MNLIRVKVHSWGKVRHPAGDFTADRSYFRRLKQGFDVLASGGYYPPVLQQHKSDGLGKEPRALEDGFIHGKVAGLEAADDGIYYHVAPTDEVREAWEAGNIENWSPSFYRDATHPETGETIGIAPRHLAFVSVPHQKTLGKSSPFYSMGECVVELSEVSTDDIRARLSARPGRPEANRLRAELVRREWSSVEAAETSSTSSGTSRGQIIAALNRKLREQGYEGHALRVRRREALKLSDALLGHEGGK